MRKPEIENIAQMLQQKPRRKRKERERERERSITSEEQSQGDQRHEMTMHQEKI